MDTTIRNLDAQAYRRIKARAALEGRTLGEAVSEAIRRYVESEAAAEVAEDRGGYGEAREGASGVPVPDEVAGARRPVAPPTLAECLEAVWELGRPDDAFADELEGIQEAQPRLGPGAWES